jgi:adenylate kinase family enzyme
MKRILIIGCGGAGKSTFAKELQKKLGIEIIHLDCHFWLPGWKMVEKEEWEKKTDEFILRDEWIMDGNYSSTMDKRIERADTIIYLDFPNWRCLNNAFMRMLKGKFFMTKRSDITEGCDERFDFDFYKWIWNYNKNNRRSNLEKLDKVRNEKQVFIVKSYKDKRKILSSIS